MIIIRQLEPDYSKFIVLLFWGDHELQFLLDKKRGLEGYAHAY